MGMSKMNSALVGISMFTTIVHGMQLSSEVAEGVPFKIWKKKPRSSGWQERHLIVSDGSCRYFKEETDAKADAKAKGSFDLKNAIILQRNSENPRPPNPGYEPVQILCED